MECKKIQQTSDYNKKEADSQLVTENRLVVASGVEGNIGVEEWEEQTIGCKISSRLYGTTWGIRTIFCINL